MLRSARKLIGLKVWGNDGDLGRVADVYCDDQARAVRYLAVELGHWLAGRQALVSPAAISQTDWHERALRVDLTRRLVQNGPSVTVRPPMSRQTELELAEFYGWPMYWTGTLYAGMEPYRRTAAERSEEAIGQASSGETRLCSARETRGYRVRTNDGDFGHLEDFLVDESTWEVCYAEVSTRSSWLLGKKVLVPSQWVVEAQWTERILRMDLDAETIRNSPAYDPRDEITPGYEAALEAYYHEMKEL